MSSSFIVESVRDGQLKRAEFELGELINDQKIQKTAEVNGTRIQFIADESIFKKFKFINEFIEGQIWNYAYLNAGLTIKFNNRLYMSKNGLMDLLESKVEESIRRYPIIHYKDQDIEFSLTHGNQYGEEYYSFVNGQYTTQGGTHLAAFREAIVKTIREFYKKNYDAADIRASIVGAVSVRVQEPVFESQTKTKLGSINMGPDGPTVKTFVNDFIKTHLDAHLHKNSDLADSLKRRIEQSERERKDMAGVRKIAKERAKKANLHNKKLRDCRVHYTDEKKDKHIDTTIFITEGDSASGSITKARDVDTQAVFSLRGKPLNCYSLTKKVVYQNEEFNLLQHALNIEESLDGLRYNNVVIATDADVDWHAYSAFAYDIFSSIFS